MTEETSPPMTEIIPSAPKEDYTAILTNHFKAHPENTAEDVPQVVTALLGTDVTPEMRSAVEAALKASDHPLKADAKTIAASL